MHDLLQYALGVLHIVTLVPYSRKPIVNATLSNDRVGIAVILDAANGAGYVEPEVEFAKLFAFFAKLFVYFMTSNHISFSNLRLLSRH